MGEIWRRWMTTRREGGDSDDGITGRASARKASSWVLAWAAGFRGLGLASDDEEAAKTSNGAAPACVWKTLEPFYSRRFGDDVLLSRREAATKVSSRDWGSAVEWDERWRMKRGLLWAFLCAPEGWVWLWIYVFATVGNYNFWCSYARRMKRCFTGDVKESLVMLGGKCRFNLIVVLSSVETCRHM